MSGILTNRVITLWRRNLPFRLASWYLALYLLIGLSVDLLPLAFGPNQLDLLHLSQPPLAFAHFRPEAPFHWLGTDGLGRDVLANLLYGCRTSLLISVPVMATATILGIGMGSLGGYFGDRKATSSLASLLVLPVAAIALVWQFPLLSPDLPGSPNPLFKIPPGVFWRGFAILAAAFGMIRLLKKSTLLRRKLPLPVDLAVVKLIEITTAIPRLILLLCLVAFVYPSLFSLMALATVSYWPGPARLLRAEIFKVKNLPYVQAATALGMSPGRIFRNHVLRNALPPIVVTFTFGLTSLLALESTLSFLGIGIPADMPSWGRLTAGVKSDMAAWWLAVLPGSVLALTVISIQTCSRNLQKALFSADTVT